jgi:3-isopropylmalate/(R)-2-methylmalate dehydratase large subunit
MNNQIDRFCFFFKLPSSYMHLNLVDCKEEKIKKFKMSTTLFDKVWDSHVVRKIEDGPDVFFY